MAVAKANFFVRKQFGDQQQLAEFIGVAKDQLTSTSRHVHG
jgi:hypothetical protein